MKLPEVLSFDTYGKEDLKILHSSLMDHIFTEPKAADVNSDEIGLLIDRNRYFLKRNAYYFMLENQHILEEKHQLDFTDMRHPGKHYAHKRSYFGDSDRIIHILELPIGGLSLYMYSRNALVKYLVK
jgi:hypothetical protein